MVGQGVPWQGVAWKGMEGHGMVEHDMAWAGHEQTQADNERKHRKGAQMKQRPDACFRSKRMRSVNRQQ